MIIDSGLVFWPSCRRARKL